MEMIRVRNNLRKPVMFRIPGLSVRLGPGQMAELPGHCKEASELKRLCLRGSLSVVEEKEGAPAAAEAKAAKEKGKKPVKKKSGKSSEKSESLEEE